MSLYGFYNPGVFLRPYLFIDNNNISGPRLFRASLNSPYFRPTARHPYDDFPSGSTTRKFEVTCAVGDFKIEEIKVTLANENGRNVVIVEGRSDESNEECQGSSSAMTVPKTFVRRHELPNECDVNRVESQLSVDGVLTITAPYDPRRIQRNIPILQTGEPSRRGAVRSVNAKGA